jgi:Na+-transporting methylmalonyl-CoA/oxaloacetate decarboxylase beta subunit
MLNAFNMLLRIISVILGLGVSFTAMNYSLQLASSKTSLWFLGWVGFILAIYLFWKLLSYITKGLVKSTLDEQKEYEKRRLEVRNRKSVVEKDPST